MWLFLMGVAVGLVGALVGMVVYAIVQTYRFRRNLEKIYLDEEYLEEWEGLEEREDEDA